jgi:ubiquinol-cytochrome c reductase iron-sulfur subunit
VRRWLLAALVFLLARRRRRPLVDDGREPIIPPQSPSPRGELAVIVLLAAGAALAIAFVVVYASSADTQWLGLTIGGSLAAFTAAAVVAAHTLVPVEEAEEEYPPPRHPEQDQEIEQLLDEAGTRVTRARLLKLTAGGAGAALTAAALVPALSLGPALDTSRLRRSPWRAGRRLVDEEGRPLRLSDVTETSMVSAFPEEADPDELGSPVVVVRIPRGELALPGGREDWAPDGVVAYSKICPHAGCAISLYRRPEFPDNAPSRALVCPCHYSTFDPRRGGTVEFGPAGRALPQLPLAVRNGFLVAAGDFSDGVGPSWWGVLT